jgi:hypothetical protein
MKSTDGSKHRWRFFRAGGFDQVRLDTAADLLAIGELDQKLWVALSCPVQGIEFDQRTLAFVDTDGDGQVRAPELIAAVNWAGERLLDADVLTQGAQGLPIAAIRADDEEGAHIRAAALLVARDLGRADDTRLSVEETSQAQAVHAAKAQVAWAAEGQALQVLGDGTAAAHEALTAVADKVDDFFMRCRLAAYQAGAGEALNASADDFKALAAGPLLNDSDAIARMPLAQVAAGAELPLQSGCNPAWADALLKLHDSAVAPLLGARTQLTAEHWAQLKAALAPYGAWLARRPDPAASGNGVRDLEKLARYARDLLPLANNFVAFKDFYTAQGPATFQLGTLYLDGRSCELCVAADDSARHGTLASLARICLVYCECTRGGEKFNIAAAFTAGDADQLMVGRNGVFYDRQGRDWNATIVRLVEHPISLRQAFWSPYKQAARLLGEQMQKLAASKAKSSQDGLNGALTGVTHKVVTAVPAGKPATAPAAFDAGRFAGIFAAIGLAVGALGTALASIVTGLFALHWWQLPLAVLGMMLIVSGPSVALAWFKLRSRNLGPLLDANGWAINARAHINIPFGTALTGMARLPDSAERSLRDPYAERRARWPYALLAGGGASAGLAYWLLQHA